MEGNAIKEDIMSLEEYLIDVGIRASDYGHIIDEEERKLLDLAQGMEQSISTNSMLSRDTNDQLQHCRSVLSKERKQVTWKQNIGKINANDSKACVHHLEAVKARIMVRRTKTVQKLGRE